MHIFYTPDILSNTYTLSQEESKHCIKVLRLKNGDKIQLINGKGKLFVTEITDDNPKKCSVKVVDIQEKERRKEYCFQIAVAPTKNISRFEFFLEKATEIGVDEIIPFISRYSERKTVKPERLEKVIISATKQSKAFFKPVLQKLVTFKDIINSDFEGQKYIAHCYDSDTKKHIKEVYEKGKNVLILIGPEGDFSKDEVKQAVSKGFAEISLSDARLRTETAGIVACQIIDFMNV
ncbi:MAG: 16S rRNA (uracil(1498)-N(3))-methyltransferase [Bacteroidales bacterium]|nr:16S rRNA (uracil(1498)-N(3))-methyltransferase [Bacteroidales bacterium]